jgi:hypothetical protein
MAAGYPRHLAISQGCMMIADMRIGDAIVSYMRDPEEAAQFAEDWGLSLDDEAETLFDRIQAARERLAIESRDGLPLPTEIEFTRKPRLRQRRTAQRKDA